MITALAAALLTLSATMTLAQGSGRDEEARSLFEAGRTAYNNAHYEDALSYFKRAHELSGRGELLYNIGQTADRLRLDEDALDAFEAYLAAVPEAANRGEVQARITRLREIIARAAAGPDTGTATAEPTPTDAVDDGGGGLSLGPIVLGGVAVAAGIAAGVFWASANGSYDDLDTSCGARGCTTAEIDESGVEGAITMTNVALVASGLALAGGIGWAVLDLSSSSSSPSDERVAIVLHPMGVAAHGTF